MGAALAAILRNVGRASKPMQTVRSIGALRELLPEPRHELANLRIDLERNIRNHEPGAAQPVRLWCHFELNAQRPRNSRLAQRLDEPVGARMSD